MRTKSLPHLPIAFLATLLLQADVAVWWVADQSNLLHYHQQRLDAVDARQTTAERRETGIDIRLARIEERLAAQSELLKDIKQSVSRKP